MTDGIDIYCPVCFAMPGEPCLEKYVAYIDGVVPIPCATHGARIADSDRAKPYLSQKRPHR